MHSLTNRFAWLFFVLLNALLTPFVWHGSEVRAQGPRSPDETVAALKVYGKLQARVFAAEPMITNPTNITVDAHGRVWVCDVVNYRHNQGKRAAGDRILILEDEDADGRADRSTVFYEEHDVDSALGICVLGERVIVSCSPNVFVLTDTDGDGRADKKEFLYTNTGKPQHDHSAHAFIFGPDGYLYWNLGNENKGAFDAAGNAVVDRYGREVRSNGKPYRHGMAFRQRIDGSDFEVLAHNLRNSYELTVDAFGDVWFTDNDDDGNRGTRFCYALNGGNYGYTDELTGRSWRTDERTGMSGQVPIRHWHQNDPGSIPNILNNGSGSPSGVEVYEAELLPAKLRGGIVHCEPGHNVVRVYLPKPEGAGYTAETIELVDGRQDQWFRPVDVATAPDGSLLVADWYDPGVGGHHQGDIERGRIYRVAPDDSDYRCEDFDFTNPKAACHALCNGNNSIRYAAWTALAEMGTAAVPALEELATNDNPRKRVRAYWLLAQLPEVGIGYINRAASDTDERVRCAAARMTSLVDKQDAEQVLNHLASDQSTMVRRAVAIALRSYHQEDFAAALWAQLAEQYDGADRWYLEALGLAAEFDWDRCLDAWLSRAGDEAWRSPAGRKIVWRSRSAQTFDKLITLLSDKQTPFEELLPLLRALDFNTAENSDSLLLNLAESALQLNEDRQVLIASEALKRLKNSAADERLGIVLSQLLHKMQRNKEFVSLVTRFHVAKHYEELLAMAISSWADTADGVNLIRFLVRQNYLGPIKDRLTANDVVSLLLTRMLAQTAEPKALQLLMPVVNDKNADVEVRREAVRAIASQQQGATELLEQAEQGKLDETLVSALAFSLQSSPWQELRARGQKLLPEGDGDQQEQLPIAEWMDQRGNPRNGQQLFAGKANCATCHQVGTEGKNVGPALTEIGSKLSRTGLYEAILFPSAAISHNYQSYVALTDSGLAITGILVDQTEKTVTLKTDKAALIELKRDEMEEFHPAEVSLMPAGLHKLITPQEIADLVAYLQTLKKQ